MNASLLTRLIAAGTPAELVAEVAAELARGQAMIDLVEQRRKRDRVRKTPPRNSAETEEIPEFQDDPPKAPTPPNTLNTLPPSPKGTAPKGKHPLPADWGMSEALVAYGARQEPPVNRDEVAGCCEDVRNWALRHGRKMADWDRCAMGFIRDLSKRKRDGPAQPMNGRRSSFGNSNLSRRYAEPHKRTNQDAIADLELRLGQMSERYHN